MLKHNIKMAWRNLYKFRLFSLVNIGGLAVSLAAFWAIALYVADELSYDRYLPTSDRVYRAISLEDWNGGHLHTATSSAPFAPILQGMIPQIEKIVRIDQEGGGSLKAGEKQLDVDNVLLADSTFFGVFPYPFLYGDPARALSGPNSVVLTKSLAEKLFGSAGAAVGKTVLFNKNVPNMVTGVTEDVPSNTHLGFNAIRSKPTGWEEEGWQYFNIYTYVLLKKGTDYRQAQALLSKTFDPFMVKKIGNSATYRMEFQPLSAIHLRSNLDFEIGEKGNIEYVYIFMAAALLILLIAMINYINLSTARSALRVKEVGVRKAIGSARNQLIVLFIAESVIITLLAALIGLILLELLLPLFNQLSGKQLSMSRFGLGSSLELVGVFSFGIGVLSGAYPAFFLSGFGILKSLKGQLGNQSANLLFRKGLVVFQFVITIVMMSTLWMVYRQLRYLDNADLGFNKEQVLSFHLRDPAVRRQIASFRNKLLESPLVEGVSGASDPLATNYMGSRNYQFEQEGQKGAGNLQANIMSVDDHFIATLQIPMVMGRNFSDQHPGDVDNAMLVNETLVKQAGWKDPIGKLMKFPVDDSGHTRDARVIGVVKDFHIYSLQHIIAPLAVYLPRQLEEEDNVYLRIARGHVPEAIAYVEEVYKSFDPANPGEYHFLDERFSRKYAAERNQGHVLMTFTLLAVGLACLGLFGLVNFSAAQRTREIGIRKVLGASTASLVRLLAGDLLKLVLIAGLIAGPIAWWAMKEWLRNFAYRIPVYWWVPVLTAGMAACIALATMTAQALKAARANPVDALKYE
jgi:putative ABC transport system permease protein